ncbi:hypothetical protein APHAL10511_000886 [Amanita phalloides]|nr:hypothetical protein APHAL10511_000886 [Amanita phalloides]
MSNKCIQNLEAANSRKKRRLVSSQQDAASQFLDLEAQQFDSSKEENSDDNSSIDGFIDDSTHPRPSLTSSVLSRLIIPNPHPDLCLAAVIARYEARRMREEREGYEMSTGDEEDNEDLEETTVLADTAWSSLVSEANPLWRVRVHEGDERKGYWLICEHLQAREHLDKAIGFIYPPSRPLWLLLEANSHIVIHEACRNSTSGSAGKRSLNNSLSLTPLAGAGYVAPLVRRYAGDLALLRDTKQWPMVEICLVPWLRHATKVFDKLVEGEYRVETRHEPWLVHPDWIGHRPGGVELAHPGKSAYLESKDVLESTPSPSTAKNCTWDMLLH